MPFLLGKRKVGLFYHIVDNISSKISKWFNKFLSYAEKSIIIQYVSNSVPTYAMSFSKLPVDRIDRIDSL